MFLLFGNVFTAEAAAPDQIDRLYSHHLHRPQILILFASTFDDPLYIDRLMSISPLGSSFRPSTHMLFISPLYIISYSYIGTSILKLQDVDVILFLLRGF